MQKKNTTKYDIIRDHSRTHWCISLSVPLTLVHCVKAGIEISIKIYLKTLLLRLKLLLRDGELPSDEPAWRILNVIFSLIQSTQQITQTRKQKFLPWHIALYALPFVPFRQNVFDSQQQLWIRLYKAIIFLLYIGLYLNARSITKSWY